MGKLDDVYAAPSNAWPRTAALASMRLVYLIMALNGVPTMTLDRVSAQDFIAGRQLDDSLIHGLVYQVVLDWMFCFFQRSLTVSSWELVYLPFILPHFFHFSTVVSCHDHLHWLCLGTVNKLQTLIVTLVWEPGWATSAAMGRIINSFCKFATKF